jgi:hypothetical protein
MPLSSDWYDATPGMPFADNSAGDISAEDLRDFAQDIAENGVAAEWFQLSSEDVPESDAEYTPSLSTNDTPVTFWMTADDPLGPQGTATSVWSAEAFDAAPANAAVLQYTGTMDQLLHVSWVDTTASQPTVTLTNVTSGCTVQPVVWIGTSATLGSEFAAGRISSTTTTGETGPEAIDISSSVVLPFISPNRYVRLGVRINPPSGSAIQYDAIAPEVDFGTTTGLVVARPAATGASL